MFKRCALAALAGVWLLCGAQALGGTPRKMAYQLMALDPASGKVLANTDVSVRMELRQGAADGPAVWSQNFSVRTDEAGVCQFVLEWTDSINWDAADYFLATIVNGQECGAPQLTSVPYALQAATVEGVVTPAELTGTWKKSEEISWVFQPDGTGRKVEPYGSDGQRTTTFRWKLDAVGHLALYDLVETLPDGQRYTGGLDTYTVQKLSATQLCFEDDLWVKVK